MVIKPLFSSRYMILYYTLMNNTFTDVENGGEQVPLIVDKTQRQQNRKCYRLLGAILGFFIAIGGLLLSFCATVNRTISIGACTIGLGSIMMIYSLFYNRHQNTLVWNFATIFSLLSGFLLISSS
jgi:uncharacterized membrane protein HdeD (DUF308 family)